MERLPDNGGMIRLSGRTNMNASTQRTHRIVAIVLASFVLALGVTASEAADKCGVKVNKKTGVISMSATNLAGIPGWRDANHPLAVQVFHLPSCVISGNDIVSCPIADPETPESKVPPASCEICVEDATGNDCCVRIKGCTPGARSCTTVSETVNVSPGTDKLVTAHCPEGSKVTGGGAENATPGGDSPLTFSIPTPDGTGWTAVGFNSTGVTAVLSASAICCRLP